MYTKKDIPRCLFLISTEQLLVVIELYLHLVLAEEHPLSEAKFSALRFYTTQCSFHWNLPFSLHFAKSSIEIFLHFFAGSIQPLGFSGTRKNSVWRLAYLEAQLRPFEVVCVGLPTIVDKHFASAVFLVIVEAKNECLAWSDSLLQGSLRRRVRSTGLLALREAKEVVSVATTSTVGKSYAFFDVEIVVEPTEVI